MKTLYLYKKDFNSRDNIKGKEKSMGSTFLGYSEKEVIELGGYDTANEIESQERLWLETYNLILKNKLEISNFIQNFFSNSNPNIILTGAGTSAFIGDILEPILQTNTRVNTKAVSTTTLVTHPELYLPKEEPTLLVSFARSGNSPESIKAVELANQVCENIYHLIITCNADGKLAKISSSENNYILLLPEETNDKSLAMTSSFSSMLLSGILLSRISEVEKLKNQVELLSSYARKITDNFLPQLKNIANVDFNRAVFLGSGMFEGIARESHLKLQELTGGKVICKFDTFLGFRHGPKAVIDEKTLVVYLFSNNPYSQKYEKDLVQSIDKENIALHTLAIMEKDLDGVNSESKIVLSESDELLEEEFLTIVSVLPAQIIGFYKSLYFGLKPDSPSESGTISRVVQGVTLYPYIEN
jgi:tagatose-6-phosphate ketose/aldose isomerase